MSRQLTKEKSADMTEVICERHLPKVFQYVSYWVEDTRIAEDLTLKALKTALARCKSDPDNQEALLIMACTAARDGIQDHVRANGCKPAMGNLTTREQEVISLKLGAEMNNRNISNILGLSEATVGDVLLLSLCKLRDCQER